MLATLEEHRKRIPEATRKVYDADTLIEKYVDQNVEIPGDERPFANPAQCFDIKGVGLRMIIAREKTLGKVRLHVSCSMFDADQLKARFKKGGLLATKRNVINFMEAMIQRLMPRTLLIQQEFVISPDKGVPHWWYQDVGELTEKDIKP